MTDICPVASPTICPDNLLTPLNTTDICTSLLTDNLNCGACGSICPAGSFCKGGTCARASPCDAPDDGIYFCTKAPAQRCVCYATTEGQGFCDDVVGANDICDTYQTCTTSLNCPGGMDCLLPESTACNTGICGKACGVSATVGNVTLDERSDMVESLLTLSMPKW